MAQTNINIRIDEELKKQWQQISKNMDELLKEN